MWLNMGGWIRVVQFKPRACNSVTARFVHIPIKFEFIYFINTRKIISLIKNWFFGRHSIIAAKQGNIVWTREISNSEKSATATCDFNLTPRGWLATRRCKIGSMKYYNVIEIKQINEKRGFYFILWNMKRALRLRSRRLFGRDGDDTEVLCRHTTASNLRHLFLLILLFLFNTNFTYSTCHNQWS